MNPHILLRYTVFCIGKHNIREAKFVKMFSNRPRKTWHLQQALFRAFIFLL
jgi:hypothetical protein